MYQHGDTKLPKNNIAQFRGKVVLHNKSGDIFVFFLHTHDEGALGRHRIILHTYVS